MFVTGFNACTGSTRERRASGLGGGSLKKELVHRGEAFGEAEHGTKFRRDELACSMHPSIGMDGGPESGTRGGSSWNDPERIVRIHVHVALASIVLAFFAPIVSWGLWLNDRRMAAGVWKRRLFALALLDTVLVLGLGLSTALGVHVDRTTEAKPRIGIVLETREPSTDHRGAVVDRVVPGSPAASAAIEPGDRIVAVDDKPIERGNELMEVIGSTEKDHERRLDIVRDGERIARTVTPTTKQFEVARTSTSLFDPNETVNELGRSGTSRRFAIGAGTLELLLVGLLVVAASWRRASPIPGLAVLSGLVALPLVSSIVLLAFKATVGVSLGAYLVSILSGSAALLVVGLLATGLAHPAPVQVGPKIRTSKAIVLGMFYGVTGASRVAIILTILVAAFDLPLRTASEAFRLDASWGLLGVGLFLVATVVVAPFAEELVFRGLLLPWLARWMKPAAALAWTTIIFAIGHLYYGAGALLIALYGLVLGWARLRTGKLWASIALHSILNGTTAIALLAAGSK
jgi:membrane protease YdiL (CAAX protease family)